MDLDTASPTATHLEGIMAELHGRVLALDEGGRPRTDDGGRLVYVDKDAGEEEPTQLEPGQGVHTDAYIDPDKLEPENTQPTTQDS